MRVIDELKNTLGLSLKRYLVLFIANLIGLYLISFGLDFTVTNLYKVVLFIFFISIFNAILWPLITKIYMPLLVWTFGIGSLILNGGIFAFFGPYFGLNIYWMGNNSCTINHSIDYNRPINHIITRRWWCILPSGIKRSSKEKKRPY